MKSTQTKGYAKAAKVAPTLQPVKETSTNTPVTASLNTSAEVGGTEGEEAAPSFVVEFIATAHTFLSTTFTFDRFIQLLVFYFTCHSYYLKHELTRFPLSLITRFENDNVLYLLGMNYMGIVASIMITVRKFGTAGFPSFDAFVFGILLPNLVALMFAYHPSTPDRFIGCLALNYLALDDRLGSRSGFAVKMGSALLFVQQVAGLQAVPVYGMVIAKYVTLRYFVEYVSTEIVVDTTQKEVKLGRASLTATERHVLVQILVVVLERASTSLELVVLQATALAVLFALVAVQPLYQFCYKPAARTGNASKLRLYTGVISAAFIVAFFVVWDRQLSGVWPLVAGASAPMILSGNPEWLYRYLIDSPFNRTVVTAWAVMGVICGVANFVLPSLLNTKRKGWHFLLLAVVLTPDVVVFFNPEFTEAMARELVKLALSLVAVGLVLVETLRATQFSPLGRTIHSLFKPFQDSRDNAGPLVILYVFLILGVTLPFFIAGTRAGTTPLLAYSGVVAVGLGDAAASCCGKALGGQTWPGPRNTKTLAGTLVGFITSTVLCFYGLKYLKTHTVADLTNLGQWDLGSVGAFVADDQILWACIFTGVTEGVARVNDNLFIPLVMVVLFEAL